MNNTVQKGWEIVRFNGDNPSEQDDIIATEFPLTVMLNGQEFATMVCSPTDLEDLLVGFLASEGMILFNDDITSLSIDEKNGFAYVEIKDRKSTRLNSSHVSISYAVFCLKNDTHNL